MAMRKLSQSVVVGLPVGVAAALIGALLTRALGGPSASDAAVCIGFVCWVVGFLAGMGAFRYPVTLLLARPDPTPEEEHQLAVQGGGVWRYFRFTTDHKVVGVQYLVLALVLFAVGGLAAMLIRVELLRPGATAFPPATYNTIVGLHGIIMIAAVIIMITGPFGNFVVPIMIGTRDMAFPRLNALSFWLLVAAVPVLLCAPFLGGFPTGWTAYAPLADQAPPGMNAFLVTILIFGVSVMLAGVNIATTVITMRAPGMTWTRLPVFVWGAAMTGSVLGVFVFPAFMVAMVLLGLDRTLGTSFFIASRGGSAWLYDNLFWIMGHPEVYVIAIPAFAVIMELLPVFTRKPLFGYKTAVAATIAIVGLSVLVWAHHMYVTGWAPQLNGPFMLTTELISIPTGVIFLVAVGTLWRGRIWVTVPMLFALSFLWNFVIGGITGIYLADVPTDYQLHGSLFVTAHFHYTLMGGAMMGFFAAFYYWYPKMTGRMLNETLGKIHFWVTQVAFNVTFLAMFYVGLQGMPRRVADYTPQFAIGNLVSSIGAFVLGGAMLVFAYNIIASWLAGERATSNPWHAKTLEWQVPTPVPLENFEEIPVITEGPYGYGSAEGPKEGAAAEPAPG